MTTSTTAPGSKRTGLLAAGIVVLLVGLLAGLGFWVSSGQRESDAVRNLARAPIGCDTTLDFEATGEFYIYVESAGQFDGAVSGDCAADGEFELSEDAAPPVSLELTAPNGDDVALDSRGGISYETAGYVGTSVRSFTIDEPGAYQLRVETPSSSSETFAAAVGRDPSDGVGAMRLGAALAALAGLLVGGLLILLSRRTAKAAPVQPETVWPGQAIGWPTSPPGMPSAPPIAAAAPVGPPSYAPIPPGGAAVSTTPAGEWPPQTAPPSVQRAPADTQPSVPTWGTSSSDGNSGDGERSPWAPPSDSAQ